MATIAEFSIPADDFPLGHLFDALPEVIIEIERVVPTNNVILPYFWVRGVPMKRVEETLEAQGALDSVTTVDDLGDQGLFRANWDPEVEGILTGIVETELTLLSATGTQEEWVFEVRTEDTDRIQAFQQYCSNHGIDVEIGRVHPVGGRSGEQHGLTPDQREALLFAYTNGYYESPPETNLEVMAEEIGIARQSFTDRLRRGYKNLIQETLVQ